MTWLNRFCFTLLLTASASWSVAAVPELKVHGGNLSRTMPSYFSGTNCRVFGQSNNWAVGWKSCRLLYNDETDTEWHPVVSKSYPPGWPLVLAAGIGIMFDSTHFPHGTILHWRFEATDNNNQVYVAQDEEGTVVYNLGFVFAIGHFDPLMQDEWETCSNAARNTLLQAHFQVPYTRWEHDPDLGFVPPSGNSFWGEQDILDAIGLCTAGTTTTHGGADTDPNNYGTENNETCICTGQFDPWNPYGPGGPPAFLEVHPWEIIHAKYLTIGSTLPPFNVTQPNHSFPVPPMNVVLFDACEVGKDWSFVQAPLYPGTNYFSYPYVEDQCGVGFDRNIYMATSLARQDAFWGTLHACETVEEATLAAQAVEREEEQKYNSTPLVNAMYYGDRFTRLRSVYTADSLPHNSSFWYWEY